MTHESHKNIQLNCGPFMSVSHKLIRFELFAPRAFYYPQPDIFMHHILTAVFWLLRFSDPARAFLQHKHQDAVSQAGLLRRKGSR